MIIAYFKIVLFIFHKENYMYAWFFNHAHWWARVPFLKNYFIAIFKRHITGVLSSYNCFGTNFVFLLHCSCRYTNCQKKSATKSRVLPFSTSCCKNGNDIHMTSQIISYASNLFKLKKVCNKTVSDLVRWNRGRSSLYCVGGLASSTALRRNPRPDHDFTVLRQVTYNDGRVT